MATSLADLEQVVLDILREEGFSSAYPQTLIDLMCNSAQQDICWGRVVHPFTGEEATAGELNFINSDVFYSNVAPVAITVNCVVGDVVLNVADTTNFPATGNLYVGGQIVTYTGVTGTSFTGVTPLLFGYEAGMQVSIAFALPADFSDIKNVIYNNRFKLPPQEYDDMYENLNAYKGTNIQRNNTPSALETPYRIKPFYTLKDGRYLIVYQLNTTGDEIHVRYEKKPATMTGSVGATIDNDIYARSCIGYLATAEILFNRWEEVRAGQVYSLAVKWVSKMYSWYNDTSYESQNGVTVQSAHGKRNI